MPDAILPSLHECRSFGDIGKSTGEGGGGTGMPHFPFSAPNLGVFGKVHRKLSSQLSNTSELEVGNGNGSGSRNGVAPFGMGAEMKVVEGLMLVAGMDLALLEMGAEMKVIEGLTLVYWRREHRRRTFNIFQK